MNAALGRFFFLACVAAFPATALSQPKSDWEVKQEERDWQEAEVKLPEFPKPENLIEFEASMATSFRFFVDGQSIDVDSRGGVVRYTLVARSQSGSENVSFDGLRCKTTSHRVYATARSDRTWSRVRDGDWKELQPKTVTRQHFALMRDFFCPGAVPILSRAEGVDALRRGMHPNAISNYTNPNR
jgi:hypothetical protein